MRERERSHMIDVPTCTLEWTLRINDFSAAFPPVAPSLLRPYRLGQAPEELGPAVGV